MNNQSVTINKFSFRSLIEVKPLDRDGFFYAFIILKFVATCLITNTHYNNVYPDSRLAVGGLLGDVLFFMVSGFVLSRPTTTGFFKWYGKRIVRIYPTVLLITLINLAIGVSSLAGAGLLGAVSLLIFPTAYVFVGAIMVLYILQYFVNMISDKKKYLMAILGFFLVYIGAYFFLLDKSVYAMNNVNNPMILFLYGLAMMTGSYIRKFSSPSLKAIAYKIPLYVLAFAGGVLYLLMNNMIRSNDKLFSWQILVPVSLLLAAFLFTMAVWNTEGIWRKIPSRILKIINFVATMTLEIYVVQRPIINALSDIVFPLNWFLITVLILVAAVALRLVVNILIQGVKSLVGLTNYKQNKVS